MNKKSIKLIELTKKYLDQKEKYKQFYVGYENIIDYYFFNTLGRLINNFPTANKIKFSLTDSKSIYFTIINGVVELDVEVFYDYTYDPINDVEVVWSIHIDNNNKPLVTNYGTIDNFCELINNSLKNL